VLRTFAVFNAEQTSSAFNFARKYSRISSSIPLATVVNTSAATTRTFPRQRIVQRISDDKEALVVIS